MSGQLPGGLRFIQLQLDYFLNHNLLVLIRTNIWFLIILEA